MLHRAGEEDLGHPVLVLQRLPLYHRGPLGGPLELVEPRAGAPDLEPEGEPDRERLLQRLGPAGVGEEVLHRDPGAPRAGGITGRREPHHQRHPGLGGGGGGHGEPQQEEKDRRAAHQNRRWSRTVKVSGSPSVSGWAM